jgi:hypothetical protein
MMYTSEMLRRKQKYGVVIRRTADAWGRVICLPPGQARGSADEVGAASLPTGRQVCLSC